MPRGNPSPKLAITVDHQVHANILAAAARDGVSAAIVTGDQDNRERLVRASGVKAVVGRYLDLLPRGNPLD